MGLSSREDPFPIERWEDAGYGLGKWGYTFLKEHLLKLGCQLQSGLVAKAGLEFSIALNPQDPPRLPKSCEMGSVILIPLYILHSPVLCSRFFL